jgi:hypothetical protein
VKVQANFPPVPASAGEARQLASRALDQWGLAAAEETALLLLTELISNGVRHANTALTMVLSYEGSRLHVGVSDHDTQPPSLMPASLQNHHGWGLRLVSLLSSDWGTTVNPDGKTVWFDLNIDELSQESAPGGQS